MYDGPGIYRHYKGGYYRVLGVAKHESTASKLVIYHSYSVDHDMDRWMDGVDWVARPLNTEDGSDAFNQGVIAPGTGSPGAATVQRFEKERAMGGVVD
jgi:hypothetical protein